MDQHLLNDLPMPPSKWEDLTILIRDHLQEPPLFSTIVSFRRAYIDYSLLIVSFFSVCVYLLFIATTLRDVINNELGIDWDTRIYILLTAVPLIFVTQVRDLRYLVPFSALANTLILVTFGITLYYIFREPIDLSNRELFPEITALPSFFG